MKHEFTKAIKLMTIYDLLYPRTLSKSHKLLLLSNNKKILKHKYMLLMKTMSYFLYCNFFRIM